MTNKNEFSHRNGETLKPEEEGAYFMFKPNYVIPIRILEYTVGYFWQFGSVQEVYPSGDEIWWGPIPYPEIPEVEDDHGDK